MPEHKIHPGYSLISFYLEFIGYFIVYSLMNRKISSSFKILDSLMLINFSVLLVGLYVNNNIESEYNTFYYIQLFIAKSLSGSLSLLLLIIALLIYPLIIRTKGVGGNLLMSCFGEIISMLFDYELKNMNDISLKN